MSLPRIFVHIPSYRDRECQWTVKDLFEKAKHPERVFVGICWQSLPEEDQDCFQVETRPDQVRILHFHINEARGLGWARQHASSLWQGEEYSLQIDSHMRFVPDWDEKMLDMLVACDSPDPVLTSYPLGYTPPDLLQERKGQYVQGIRRFMRNGILEFTTWAVPEDAKATRPLPTAACAGGFIFGSSRILRDVPFDAEIYFSGEEPSLAVRLWTHGFDLFSPHEPVIYHYYKRADGSRHWNDSKEWTDLHKRTVRRMKALCEPEVCPPEDVAALGIYGLGTQRSLAEYQLFSGVNFVGKTLADYAQRFPGVQSDARKLDADLEPTPGLHLFILDDEGLLFSESKGEFYRLNPSATFVWCALEESMAWSEIGAALAEWRGIAPDAAERELANLVAHWLGQKILRKPDEEAPVEVPKEKKHGAQARPPRFDPAYFDFRVRHYRLLGVPFQVRYGDRELEYWVHPVLAHLATDGKEAPVHTVTAARILHYLFLFCDNDRVYLGQAADGLAPIVKFTLLDRAIRQQDHILHLHAGAVMKNGKLVLLPAKSGSGKTTLTARLVAAGCEYFSDETVLFERDTDRIHPIPISLCIKETGTDLLERYFPGLSDLPLHDRQDNIKVRYLPPPPHSLPKEGRSGTADLVVFPRYAKGAPTVLQPLSAADAFGRLLEESVAIPKALTLEDAAALVRIIEGTRCFALTSGDLDAAAESILALCGQGG